jgi:hypothetical protein
VSFEHYISYGSTDQESLRDLVSCYDGLVVPGTIAAFQSDGTRGFVLSWSARNGKPYLIDPRFPLFQNALPQAKKSHVMLADVFGDAALVGQTAPTPTAFGAARVASLAANWVDFNVGFDEVKSKVFDKYASRLGEAVVSDKKSLPSVILPPYFMADSISDPWFAVSVELWEAAVKSADGTGIEVLQVLASTRADGLQGMLDRVNAGRDVVVWVSALDELRAKYSELLAYGEAIRDASGRGVAPFALYGGYFSILLGKFGLRGSSHGVGFGDHRDWIELPSSGAPQARYYVYALHRYVSVDLAVALWRISPNLIVDAGSDDPLVSPGSLSYHDLMRHSLAMRAREIEDAQARSTMELKLSLTAAAEAFSLAVAQLPGPVSMRRRAEELYSHLGLWAEVLDALMDA